MTQGARGGASKTSDYGLLGPVETPRDMDAEALWNLLLAERARHAAELEERDRKIAAHEDARASDHELIARLSRIICDLQRTTFGARSGKLDPDQLALALEDLEQELAAADVRLATPAEGAPRAGIPIIALTANVLDVHRASYAAAGMDGVLSKPISPAQLFNEIAQIFAVERAAAQRPHRRQLWRIDGPMS